MMVSVVMMMMLMRRTAQWIKTNGSSAALIDFKADRWEAQLGCGWHARHDDHDHDNLHGIFMIIVDYV